MTRKPISPADSAPIRVVLVTLDNHIAAAVDDARRSLAADLPGLTLSVHAATDGPKIRQPGRLPRRDP